MNDLIEKLKKLAQVQEVTFEYILKVYVLERILYRFSIINPAQAIVRGSLITRAWGQPKHVRLVQDLDFLLDCTFDEEKGKSLIDKLLKVETDDDVQFANYDSHIIWADSEQPGIRFIIPVSILSHKMEVQIDVAFNDPLVPPAVYWHYPDLFGNRISVQTITPELACAWKIHGLFEFWHQGSQWQMKTLYDIFIFIDTQDLDRNLLKSALRVAFEDRKTPFYVYRRVLEGKFGQSKGTQAAWQKWLNKYEGKISYSSYQPFIQAMRNTVDEVFQELI